MHNKIYLYNILKYLILLIPISAVSGSFILNTNLILISLTILFHSFILPKKYLKNKWLIAAFLLLLLQVFSSLINEFNEGSLIRSISFMKFIFLALGMNILFNYDHRNFFIFLKVLFLVVVFVLLDSLVQYFFGQNIFGNPYTNQRLSSIFGDEYIVGSFICKMGFLISPIFLLIIKNFKYKNVLLFLFLSALLSVILITGDRMPSLLFLMGITVFYFFKGFKDYKNFLLIFLIYIMCITMFFLNPTVSKRFKEITHERYGLSKNFDIKNSQWGAHFLTAWEIFKENPILGIGPKNFRIESCATKYENIDSASAKKRCTTHPHNIILEILSEHGLLGMLLFLVLLYLIIKGVKINYEHNIFFLISLLICLWPIGTSGSIFTTVNGTFLWINIGIILYSKDKDLFT
mgnify:CR=1 FL=1|tara:strand:- start:121 stop:1335 length:1215 start_codon:yes stop_codon:yes gene_type:complete